ncbi:transient receptor potential cation channel subfamily M member 6 isoform X3 [Pseudoliparis swirei]|uniref:transient receptor potential cation channel subfamily M member 6 isoform X3 n=1 Tax=Pseudoliparis swirei TaxID=2059687 RepID=UPI0024BD7DBC|nr:transient receptor potential cation channel subfamily M member 6 isoform X3 [Pseudoliparis swirei]
MSRKSWIEESFSKRDCVKFIPSSRDLHRCIPGCQVCQNLIRCGCGRLIGEHSWQESLPPTYLYPGPGQDLEEDWSIELHTKASPTNAFGTIDFQDTATRVCRAKYVRVAVDSKPEVLFQLMLREWQMERPKLILSVQGGSENFTLPRKVKQAFSKGLITAALSTGAWILTDGINTGVSKYVGEAVKTFGGHNLRKRNTVGITPWGVIDNNTDLIGRDVFRPYQPLGNPLSKRACLNGFHSHFLLVDDGTLGKHGCQQGLRRQLEKHIHLKNIHPRLKQGVPVVCVVVEGGPAIVSAVLDYVSNVPPVPVFVFEGSGRAADLLAFLHKQTSIDRQLDADIKEGFLVRIGDVFGVETAEASQLCSLLLQCMDHRESITIFDSEDQTAPDAAILTTILKGTSASPAEQLSMALAWDRADIAQKHVLVYGQHWEVGSLEQAMLDALVMDRVSFVKLLIDNGMTMSRFLTVYRLEELYNTPQGQTDRFLRHLVEDAKQTSLPIGYRLSLIDMGLVIESLIGGAYRSSYTRKHFRAAYSILQGKEQDASPGSSPEVTSSPGPGDAPLLVPFNFNDLFVWAILHQRQQMALFLWQHGEETLARAAVACKLYRSMAFEARQSSMDDNISDRFTTYSLEFGQLAVDLLDCAFRQNKKMAMKLLISEMDVWSHYTCLQMSVSSCHRPFVSHSSTQTLLTDLWTGPLNMRKNSFVKIILSLLLPPAILLLEFKSKAEMCHVPQSHEAILFGLESGKSEPGDEGSQDAERGLSFHDRYSMSEAVSSTTVQCLSWITRIYDFYTAPVVKFWFHTMSYLVFLMLFSYVVLVEMQDQPSVQEWLVIAYILSTAVEKTREVLMSEPRKLSQKLKIWFSEYWNISDVIAILLFLAGLTLRWYANPYRTAGRISYCLDIIFWFVRVLDLLAVNQQAGPYLTMIIKMTSNMFFIVVMMAIVLLSFGVSRKAILSPNEDPSWSLARDIVFQPYFMIFGEVYATEIDPCDDGNPCPPASFLTAFLQAVYMFFQYIIMVNILIAFFNNVYFDLASISKNLWKYNRYRYIMTYQELPWLPPPFILISHMTIGLRAIYRKCIGDAEREERGSGLKLYLGHEDRKRLHEFEEKCVEAYFHEKSEGLQSCQMNRIRATSERAEEMCMMVGEVSDKVIFIQDSLSGLDGQLGQLQDLSALAVDTLTLLSASDSLQQEEARLAQCQLLTESRHILPHSWTLPHTSEADCDVLTPTVNHPGENCLGTSRAGSHASLAHFYGGGPSHCGSPLSARSLESSYHKPHVYPSQEKTSVDKQAEERTHEQLSNVVVSRASSNDFLLSKSRDISEGLVNPAFSPDDSRPSSRYRPSSPCERSLKLTGWRYLSRDSPYGHCRSLSSSVENMTFSGAPLTLMRGSFPSLNEPMDKESLSDERSLRENRSLLCSKNKEWSKSSDFTQVLNSRGKRHSRKTVKIQESSPDTETTQSNLSDACWRRNRRLTGEPACWSASTSLSQLNFEPMDLLKKQVFSHQDVWSSWARSMSHKSSLQSGIASEVKSSSFQSSEILYPHYSAMERNNLMRLAQTIPFTPVSILGGEEVSIYSLEEVSSGADPECGPVSSWSSRGLSAMLQPLSSEEGSMDGGLRLGCRVLCTWAERNVLGPGLVYVVKAFRPEVVRAWQMYFDGSTALQLCLREIQQQRAAQKMMQMFNEVKPDDMHHSPRCAFSLVHAFVRFCTCTNVFPPTRYLDVALVFWHSNGQWMTIERNMSGDFRKYNNNTGEEITPCCSLEEMLLAFSHWTYEYSCRELLVLDIQGVEEELTDPTVIMADDQRGEMLFGPDNLGDAAISGFLQKHSCGGCCRRLGLTDLRKSPDSCEEEPTWGKEEQEGDEPRM